jgi:acyl carrier protein
MSYREEIKSFIAQNFLFSADSSSLGDSESLLEKGIVDSTGILELVTHIEEAYGIRVLDQEMLPANLDSIEAIAGFIERKKLAG